MLSLSIYMQTTCLNRSNCSLSQSCKTRCAFYRRSEYCMEMESSVNSTRASEPPSTTDGSTGSDVGPLSILPICVSLLAVVAIAVAACVFYRKRQRERAQLLARQLRVTERRIDAVGSLWEKRERRSSVRNKQTYYPPTDVRASASEPSVVTGPRPHYVIRAFQPRLVPLPSSSSNHDRPRPRSLVNSSVCSCDYGVEICSMCKEGTTEDDAAKKSRRSEYASDGSLAVELGTIPSVGSLSAADKTPSQAFIRRTKSDSATTPGEKGALARRSLQIRSSLLVVEGDTPVTTPMRHVLEWMEKSSNHPPTLAPPLPPSLEVYTETEGYMTSTVATSTNEQEPPPNTPVSRSVVTGDESETPHTVDKALSYISEDTQSEKWV